MRARWSCYTGPTVGSPLDATMLMTKEPVCSPHLTRPARLQSGPMTPGHSPGPTRAAAGGGRIPWDRSHEAVLGADDAHLAGSVDVSLPGAMDFRGLAP